EKVQKNIPGDSLTPSLFLCLAAKRSLIQVEEVGITHKQRETGACSIRYMKLLRFCLRSLYQLFEFRFVQWKGIEKSDPLVTK
ncbi:hypothetical protein ACFLR7_06120, partial [Acidobacteriota bacterium]